MTVVVVPLRAPPARDQGGIGHRLPHELARGVEGALVHEVAALGVDGGGVGATAIDPRRCHRRLHVRSPCVLEFPKERIEALEALLPMGSVLADPVGNVAQRVRTKPSRPPLRLTTLLDETGPLEHPQVLGDGGLAHVERLGEVLDRRLARGEPGQDRPPGRVGKSGEGAR